MNRWQDSL